MKFNKTIASLKLKHLSSEQVINITNLSNQLAWTLIQTIDDEIDKTIKGSKFCLKINSRKINLDNYK